MSQTGTANAGMGRLALRDFGGTGLRLLRYSLVRAISIGITVVIAVYLTIIIANMGPSRSNPKGGDTGTDRSSL